jgi:hypothetical protein
MDHAVVRSDIGRYHRRRAHQLLLGGRRGPICFCHYGRTVSSGTVATCVRMMARQNQRATLSFRGMAIGGLSAVAALGLMLLAF